MAKYTFLLPAFKVKYLALMLDSIQKQTYRDFCVLISDDCSTEPVGQLCRQYLADRRFRYRRNDTNMGSKSLVFHWNLLVDMCDTEFLIMASDDDVYDPHFLEEIDRLTVKYPEVDLFHSRARCIDGDGNILKLDALYGEKVSQLFFFEQLDYYNHIECVANYVYRTKALKEAGGFVDFPLAWSSDTATANIMSRNGVVNTADILFSFRMSGLNISSQMHDNKEVARKKFIAFCMYDELMERLLEEITIDDSMLQATILDRVRRQHHKRMAGLIGWYACDLSVADFLKYIYKYRRKGYIDSMFIIWKKWLKARLCG